MIDRILEIVFALIFIWCIKHIANLSHAHTMLLAIALAALRNMFVAVMYQQEGKL